MQTVSIAVAVSGSAPDFPRNNPPTADAQAVTVDEDTAKAITLSGSDPDGDLLTFDIVTGPSHGTLSGDAPNLTYTPNPNFQGSDSFTFTVADGTADSAPATTRSYSATTTWFPPRASCVLI